MFKVAGKHLEPNEGSFHTLKRFTGVTMCIVACAHGRAAVGEATEHNQVWDEEGVDYSYDYSAQVWKCGHCNKTSEQVRDILAHLKGGAHEVPRYFCSDCNKKFKSMQALQNHFESTGHSPQQQRLTSVRPMFCHDARLFYLLIILNFITLCLKFAAGGA